MTYQAEGASSRAAPRRPFAPFADANHERVLDVVDKLRDLELQFDGVELPQLVVCGDQSSGKSSVLDAITEVPFPRKDGQTCTRFATDIVLRKGKELEISASIKPHEGRTYAKSEELRGFSHTIREKSGIQGLIDDATRAMGIDTKNLSKDQLSRDVLRINIKGPNVPSLTLMDLPGLIRAVKGNQREEDIQIIHDMTVKYIKNKESIILPIISANCDVNCHEILSIAKDPGIDPERLRTLGIITKPDILQGRESLTASFIQLASNNTIKLDLGWHTLRNRSHTENEYSSEQRNEKEDEWLSTGLWTQVPVAEKGVKTLKPRLSKLLFGHIRKKLPELQEEVQKKLDKVTADLSQMGNKPSNHSEQRDYLFDMCDRFQRSFRAGRTVSRCHLPENASQAGTNDSPDAGDTCTKSLRASITELNTAFLDSMRYFGHTYYINSNPPRGDAPMGKRIGYVGGHKKPPEILDKDHAIEKFHDAFEASVGKELIGGWNPDLVENLFRQQSVRWSDTAKDYVNRMVNLCHMFVRQCLRDACGEDIASVLFRSHVDSDLRARQKQARDELNKLLRDQGKYIQTLNPQFVTLTQDLHKANTPVAVPRNGNHVAPSNFHPAQNPTAAQIVKGANNPRNVSTSTDLERRALNSAIDIMMCFYECTMPTFIDNVAIQVTERSIVQGLEQVFSPSQIGRWSDKEIEQISTECEETAKRRSYLENLKAGLEEAHTEITDLMNIQVRGVPKQNIPQIRTHSKIS